MSIGSHIPSSGGLSATTDDAETMIMRATSEIILIRNKKSIAKAESLLNIINGLIAVCTIIYVAKVRTFLSNPNTFQQLWKIIDDLGDIAGKSLEEYC
jgi:hypothetical protein